jgi:hypothetical protein
MKTAKVKITGVSPYSQSRYYSKDEVPPLEKEANADYTKRTWMNHVNCNEHGDIYVPPMSLKNCVAEAAKYLSISIPGKGKATYTKHFEAGVLVLEPMMLGVNKKDVKGEWLFLPSDGIRGSGKRVMKCYPIFHQWGGVCEFMIIDETITEDVFTRVLTEAGKFIGIGRFRPRNNGFYGRFKADVLSFG